MEMRGSSRWDCICYAGYYGELGWSVDATEVRSFGIAGLLFLLGGWFCSRKGGWERGWEGKSLNASMHGSVGHRALGVSFVFVEGTDVRGTSR